MRFSQFYAPTLKEAPSDSDLISYEYLVRGGFIRKVAAGIFTYLPMGNRVIQKITKIVREEMDNAGCLEMLMPIAQPASIWKQSGRWEDYGPEMMKIEDRHHRHFTLGPTHEEMVTVTVKNELVSYKDLPKNLYQINTKYRDEIRPRFGLLRAREFIMKDAYSFHADEQGLDETYNIMYKAYERILERMGLDYMAVEADSGAIGGSNTHEFVILAANGESPLFHCPECGYKATDERAEYRIAYNYADEELKEIEQVATPDQKTIEDISEFLKVEKQKIVKSLIFKGRDGFILALIRGDLEINIAKLRAFAADQTLELAQPADVMAEFGTPIGFIGPVGLKKEGLRIVADHSVKGLKNFVTGAMKMDTHYLNTNLERDFTVDGFEDIKMVAAGDPCPNCSGKLEETRGIEMGQVFKLGKKYSESLDAKFAAENGDKLPFYMGCYGWGVSRSVSGIVEQLHDDNGILWPMSCAPFEAIITVIKPTDEDQMKHAEAIYRLMNEAGIEVILDDRNSSAGSKFKDADLIGIPLRVTVGKGIKKGLVEMKLRNESERHDVDISEGYTTLIEQLKKAKEEYDPRKRK
jgi:prolyl-tRNA synthetase